MNINNARGLRVRGGGQESWNKTLWASIFIPVAPYSRNPFTAAVAKVFIIYSLIVSADSL
jgi:hypothetical protein